MRKIYIFLTILFFCTSVSFAQIGYKWHQLQQLSSSSINFYHPVFNVVVGNNGKIFRFNSTNNTWEEESSGTTQDLNSMPISNLPFIVGDNGTVLSKFQSSEWISIGTGLTKNLYSSHVQLINFGQNTGLFLNVVGQDGFIARTNIFNMNWTAIPSSVSHTLREIKFNTNQSSYDPYGIIVGDNGTILKSTDRGESWFALNSGVNNDLHSIHFIDTRFVIVVGSVGTVLRSSNKGETWNVIQTSFTKDLLNVQGYDFSSYNKYFLRATGKEGITVHSTDFGANWNLDTVMGSPDLKFFWITKYPEALAVASNGYLYQMKLDPLYNPYQFISGNQIKNWFANSGIFNRNKSLGNAPGFEWPAGSGKYAFFTTGLSIVAYYNGQLRMASASYGGEYRPGFVNSSGVFETDTRFKIYKVSPDEPAGTNWDYDNWALMVPFGAPYEDINHNGQFDPGIDKPGIKNSSETIFMHLTDADPGSHIAGEGFAGGTQPLFAEVAMTSWSYDYTELQNVQFIKWDITNSSNVMWEGVFFGLFSDPDLGEFNDDYIGCDTILDLGYVFNATNQDGIGSGISYGVNPPAAGLMFVKTIGDLGLTSFNIMQKISSGAPYCEAGSLMVPSEAYNFLKGVKKDNTPWVIPNTSPPQTTKFTYSGDPETESGWTEYKGSIQNCGGSLTGNTTAVNPPGDRRFLMSSGSVDLNIQPGQSGTVAVAQLIARGSNHLHSVTRLKEFADTVRTFFGTININNISGIVPERFTLYQNFPNPFNPVTKIRFDIPANIGDNVILKVYNSLGQEISTLVSQSFQPGTYEYDFNSTGLASGVYFYVLSSGSFFDSKKMVILK